MSNPPPPFPVKRRTRKIKSQDKEYQRFVQMLKEIKINVSAHELFTGIPKYAKFFKTMLSNKEGVAEEPAQSVVPCSGRTSRSLRNGKIRVAARSHVNLEIKLRTKLCAT